MSEVEKEKADSADVKSSKDDSAQKEDVKVKSSKSSIADLKVKLDVSDKVKVAKSDAGSGKRSASSISSSLLEEERKRVVLDAKMRMVRKQHQIEQEKLRLKLEEEMLLLSTEIEISEAASKVIRDCDLSERLKDFDTEDEKPLYNSNLNATAVTFNPRHLPNVESTPTLGSVGNVESTGPVAHVESTSPSPGALVNSFQVQDHSLMQSVVNTIKKPPIDIKPFSGDPLSYQMFWRQFNSKIIPLCETCDEKLNYLEQFTTGEANRVVKGFCYLNSDAGYEAAARELKDRYGNSNVMAQAFIKRALEWPIVKPDNPKMLDSFSICLVESEFAIQSMDAVKVLEYPDNMRQLVSKLPGYMQNKWRNIVYDIQARGDVVKFTDLVKFVKCEAKKVCDPVYGKDSLKVAVPDKKVPSRANVHFLHDRNLKGSGTSKPCLHCSETTHSLVAPCEKFMKLDDAKRSEFVKTKSLCFGCGRLGHQKKDCRSRQTCAICGKLHLTILHFFDDGYKVSNQKAEQKSAQPNPSGNPPPAGQPQQPSGSVPRAAGYSIDAGGCALAIVPVKVRSKDSLLEYETHAFLDPGSTVSFCSNELVSHLGLHGKRKRLNVDTLTDSKEVETTVISDLVISNWSNGDSVKLPNVYSSELPVSKDLIPRRQDFEHWPHMRHLQIPEIDSGIDLLLGNNVPEIYRPLEFRCGPPESPHATRTILGWVPWNVVRENCDSGSVNSINHIRCESVDTLETLIKQSTDLEFAESLVDEKLEYSADDKLFISKVESSIQFVDGHYQIALPLKDDKVILPNNLSVAHKRLNSLKSKLSSNKQMHSDYCKFMEKLIEKNHAEKVDISSSRDVNQGRIWYLPHHGVYHPKKKDKLRVVFDGASTYEGVSINSVLLQGPDLANSLVGVLLRFREGPVAVTSDIEQFFYQVVVPESDRDFLRFLWWPDGNLDLEPSTYRMRVHVFGTTSSPSVANFALRRALQDGKLDKSFRSFYVDDSLKSLQNPAIAKEFIHRTMEGCKAGGFELTKVLSNCQEVVESLPDSKKSCIVENVDVANPTSPVNRALGVVWSVDKDVLSYKVDCPDRPCTRRGILSTIHSVYDPLGYAGPVVLPAKILLQGLARAKVDWDKPIEGEDLKLWLKWLEDLPKLENLELPRCLVDNEFGELSNAQLHYFCDGSEKGYGVVGYLRSTNMEGQVQCRFLISKSRVTPVKTLTIPKIELASAALAVKLHKMVSKELEIEINDVYFWSDSTCVLKYINNESSRFKTYVANRVALIQQLSDVQSWRYVNTADNPADDASRGFTVDEYSCNSRWTFGPEFLCKPESQWPIFDLGSSVIDDGEVKTKRVNVHTNVVSSVDTKFSAMNLLLNHYSDWFKLKRAVALLIWAKDRLKFKVRAKKNGVLASIVSSKPQVLYENFKKAENVILEHIQVKHWSKEIGLLKAGKSVGKRSALRKLDPFIDNTGLVRVGGRLDLSALDYDTKHPVLVPGHSSVARLLIEDSHRKIGHLGKNSVQCDIRHKFWILGGGRLIKKLVRKCVLCRKYQAKPCTQKMAGLPADRVASDLPPFHSCGVDYFGPFECKMGRSVVKRYGCIFTCSVSRAVHLEMAYSLDTDSCINCYRRFIARRGSVNTMRSDNGTNLVGSEKELRLEIDKWNKEKIARSLQQQSINWIFNPPAASHMGGMWERIIRSVRKVLFSLLKEQSRTLDDESLATLFCEVEAILNNRPITKVSDDLSDPSPLTPNHLLLGQPGVSLPPGVFCKQDIYVKRRWRQVQYLADQFWVRWTRDYLPTLQERQKWLRPERNLKPDDIVLLVDNTPRGAWALGRVLEVFTDKVGVCRSVKVKVNSSILERPVHKLCLIMECEN